MRLLHTVLIPYAYHYISSHMPPDGLSLGAQDMPWTVTEEIKPIHVSFRAAHLLHPQLGGEGAEKALGVLFRQVALCPHFKLLVVP